MSKNDKTTENAVAETAATGHAAIDQAVASQGRRARSSFMMKNFADQDWIMKNVVAKGKGTQVMLGRVFGIVTSVTEKKGTLPNGEPSTSQVLNGTFETEDYTTGEISTASTLYLSNSFGQSIKALFASDNAVTAVNIDTDIGVEATGKGIPYAWVVVNHIDNEAMSPLKAMKSARGRPAGLPAPVAQKQLTAS